MKAKVWLSDKEYSGIKAGSAIVSWEEGKQLAYYEGNLNGACNLNTLYDRACVAAGRMRDKYPTTALTMVNTDDLLYCGTIDVVTWDMVLTQSNMDQLRISLEKLGLKLGRKRSTNRVVGSHIKTVSDCVELVAGPDHAIYKVQAKSCFDANVYDEQMCGLDNEEFFKLEKQLETESEVRMFFQNVNVVPLYVSQEGFITSFTF